MTNLILDIILKILIKIEEHFLQILPRIIFFSYKLRNYKIPIIINITYKTNKDFESIKNKTKKYFKFYYNYIKIYKSKESLIFLVNDSFEVSVFNFESQNENKVSFITSKLPVTINDIKKEVDKFLITLNKIKSEFNNDKEYFNEEEFHIKLFLPYIKKYVNITPPDDMNIKSYTILFHNKNSIMDIKGKIINLYSKTGSTLLKLIDNIFKF